MESLGQLRFTKKRVRELEEENTQLKKKIAEQIDRDGSRFCDDSLMEELTEELKLYRGVTNM